MRSLTKLLFVFLLLALLLSHNSLAKAKVHRRSGAVATAAGEAGSGEEGSSGEEASSGDESAESGENDDSQEEEGSDESDSESASASQEGDDGGNGVKVQDGSIIMSVRNSLTSEQKHHVDRTAEYEEQSVKMSQRAQQKAQEEDDKRQKFEEKSKAHAEATEKRKAKEEQNKKDAAEAAEKKKKNEEAKKKKDEEESKQKKAAEEKEKKENEAKQKKEKEEKEKKEKESKAKKDAAAKQERHKKAAEKKAKEQASKKRRERSIKAKERRVKYWSNVHLRSGYRTYGMPYMPARMERWGTMCFGGGLVRGSTSSFLGYLPGNCRPVHGRLIFTTFVSGYQSRVDVLRDRRVYLITRRGSWASLAGIAFNVHGGNTGFNLVWGWRNYGYGYRATQARYQSGICMMSGLIRHGRWGYFGRFHSSACRPDRRLIFTTNNHAHITRTDVLRNGYFLRSGGYAYHHWVSLDGILFTRTGGRGLGLRSGWRNYGYYRPARYHRVGRVCLLSGLIKNHGNWNSRRLITVLPKGCRPGGRIVAHGNVHLRAARVDILKDGRVYYISQKHRWNWLSLSGITFIVRG